MRYISALSSHAVACITVQERFMLVFIVLLLLLVFIVLLFLLVFLRRIKLALALAAWRVSE